MTLEEAQAKYPEAALIEDMTMDLGKVLRRRLVIPAKAPGEEPRVVWEEDCR